VIRSVFLAPGGELKSGLERHEVQAALADGNGLLWVHVSAQPDHERQLLSDVFGFHQLAIDDCFNGRVDTPKIDDYGSHLFIVSQSVTFHSRGEPLDLDEVDLFLGPNFVVTVTEDPVASVEELLERATTNPALMNRGADFLAHTIIDSLVDLMLPAVEEMDEALDNLEQEILNKPDKRYLPEVLLLKRNTLRLRRAILPQRDMVNRLPR
jgi:magnesium transporter